MKTKKINQLLFSSYILVIILLVLLPLNKAGALNSITIVKIRGDYFFHILLFIPWFFTFKNNPIKPIYWLIIGLLFASSAEAVQYFLSYRTFNINDLISNSIGVGVSYLLYIVFGSRSTLFFSKGKHEKI